MIKTFPEKPANFSRSSSLRRFPDLSEAESEFITSELDRLEAGGLAWDDFYTQCILQNIVGSIQFG